MGEGPGSSAKVMDKGKGPAVKKKGAGASSQEKSQEVEEEEEEEEPNPEEDVTNLQLAWEILELAKISFLKEPMTKERLIKAADCHLTLGEVSLESEAYDAAIDDFKKCLDIQTKNLEEDDRFIAETHYQLGLTHSFAKNYSEARNHFRKALKVLETRIGKLTRVVEEAVTKHGSKEKALAVDSVWKAKEEIGDLKE